ncbi:sulfurtransferase complex subunit TusB [Glaesserella sp.]|uniref:sulfurtransferase complex subunit TusB n=1 Tax=Glaesserella sp. TaxID=2094731 RepID=UPI0035A16C48
MLYTFAKPGYDHTELQALLAQVTPQDAVVLWQDGVLQAVRFAHIFANLDQVFVLENDIQARGLTTSFNTISLDEFVKLTEQYYPQTAF